VVHTTTIVLVLVVLILEKLYFYRNLCKIWDLDYWESSRLRLGHTQPVPIEDEDDDEYENESSRHARSATPP
jgi:hypothetical protein